MFKKIILPLASLTLLLGACSTSEEPKEKESISNDEVKKTEQVTDTDKTAKTDVGQGNQAEGKEVHESNLGASGGGSGASNATTGASGATSGSQSSDVNTDLYVTLQNVYDIIAITNQKYTEYTQKVTNDDNYEFSQYQADLQPVITDAKSAINGELAVINKISKEYGLIELNSYNLDLNNKALAVIQSMESVMQYIGVVGGTGNLNGDTLKTKNADYFKKFEELDKSLQNYVNYLESVQK